MIVGVAGGWQIGVVTVLVGVDGMFVPLNVAKLLTLVAAVGLLTVTMKTTVAVCPAAIVPLADPVL